MNIALILSGGTGTRLGSEIPKQYIKVFDRPVISYCIEQLVCHEKIDGIQIVALTKLMQLPLANASRPYFLFCYVSRYHLSKFQVTYTL